MYSSLRQTQRSFAQLIGVLYDGDIEEAVRKAVEKMQGAYGIGVICRDEPDKMIAVRKDSPLIVGLGQGCNFIASDIPALLKYVRQIYLIENNEMVVLTANDVKIYNADHEEVHRDVFNVTWTLMRPKRKATTISCSRRYTNSLREYVTLSCAGWTKTAR